MSTSVISVSELTTAIRSLLEPKFRGICVRGEISNFKAQSSGHLYFSLKDTDAQISAALFRGNAASLPRMPKEGDQVIAKGELSVYAPRGSYQLIVRELQFLGVGELLLKLHQLKEALSARGWFDASHKKSLPKLPKRIGIVTSPTGAVIQDILNVLTRRFAGFQVLLNPVKVQGEGAAQEIAKAIYEMNHFDLADVLIVGRGGGSIEDLFAFNEEIVAKAIFESKIPIISAVGHETDFTIADLVADVRAPTPSAAAEIVIAEKAQLLTTLDRFRSQIKSVAFQKIEQRRHRLQALSLHPSLSQPHTLLAHPSMRLDDFRQNIDQSVRKRLDALRFKLTSLEQALDHLRPSRQIAHLRDRVGFYHLRLHEMMRNTLSEKSKIFNPSQIRQKLELQLKRTLAEKKDLLSRLTCAVESLHPKNLLKKGYTILFSEKDNSLILSAKDLEENQPFRAVLADGSIRAKALTIKETPDGPHF